MIGDYRLERLPDDRVGGYRLERRLDPGGLHEVWLARAADGRAVALKLGGAPLPPGPALPGLVPVLESGVQDGVPYQVMPLVAGPTLAQRAAERPLDRDAARRVVAALARTLDALHASGGAHGDVRAANVVLGEDSRVTLLDR
ncbi:MAG: hypothetical protein Q7S25_03525, partial [Candidatus Limnocylindria bacterium]|nr:hypothetical protein [Candidatus Limnocylindria bacterium]